MPGAATFALDDSEFQDVMGQYIKHASTEGAAAMNRTMNSLAIFGVQEAGIAEKAEIENIESLEWWPKYVAKTMVKHKAVKLATRMEKASAKGKTITGRTYQRLVGLHYTRDEARRMSKRMIRRRSVAVGFVRFFFVSLSRRMREVSPGLRAASGKSFAGFEVKASPATADNPAIRATVRYTYRRRGEQSVQKAEALLQEIIDRARPRLIADMREYIARKVANPPVGIQSRRAL